MILPVPTVSLKIKVDFGNVRALHDSDMQINVGIQAPGVRTFWLIISAAQWPTTSLNTLQYLPFFSLSIPVYTSDTAFPIVIHIKPLQSQLSQSIKPLQPQLLHSIKPLQPQLLHLTKYSTFQTDHHAQHAQLRNHPSHLIRSGSRDRPLLQR